MGLVRLHHAQAQVLQDHGAADRHRRQLVERVLPTGGSDRAPRGDHVKARLHGDHGAHRRKRAQEDHSPHLDACGIRADPAGARHGRGVLPVAEVNCRAFGREDTLVRRPAVRFSQIADAGTALGGGNPDPIAPRREIGQAKTGF